MTVTAKRRARDWRSAVRKINTKGPIAAPLFVQESDARFTLTFSAAVVRRLGWLAGQRVVIRELPANADAGTKAAILVESE